MKPELRNVIISSFLLIEAFRLTMATATTSDTAITLRNLSSVQSRMDGRGMGSENMMEQPKSKPWLGYYDFLITEGSYKFWVVFELFTVALLIYSAFAAVYYAKYTVPDYDYDYFFKKRSSRSLPEQDPTFLGLSTETYLRIFEAIADLKRKYS